MSCGLSDSLDSTIVVTELQVWSHRFILDSLVNKYEVPYPPEIPVTPEIPTNCYPQGSFISMLFDDNFSHDYYEYLYAEKSDKLSWPWIIRQRLLVYPRSAKFMIIDNLTGTNLFRLQQDDFIMLDALLAFRIDTYDSTATDSTSLVLIDDSTASVGIVYDSTSGITVITASLATLTTELSKLIFVFLDLMINENTSNYDTTVPISTSHALQTIYELYVIDKYFEVVSARETDVAPYCPIRGGE
jgi:hypothetical protein